jgi:hypothetical protein
MHAKNGANQRQEAFIYDGDTGQLLDSLSLTMTVSGSFRNKIVKWGFGTRRECTGLNLYVDDLLFVRGSVNPGPAAWFPRSPSGWG